MPDAVDKFEMADDKGSYFFFHRSVGLRTFSSREEAPKSYDHQVTVVQAV